MGVQQILIALAATLLFCGSGCSGEDTPVTATKPTAPTTQSLDGRLRRHVEYLAGAIGERNVNHPAAYQKAADYIVQSLRSAGFEPELRPYNVDGVDGTNIIVELTGAKTPDEVVILGAHYDSVSGSPGANDNASGVAAVMEIAATHRDLKPARTLRFVFFANEEPPNFVRPSMGSLVYARQCFEREEKIVAMLSMETIGYYSDSPGSQKYPPPLSERYPDVGNFIGLVADLDRKEFVEKVARKFRDKSVFPMQVAALPPMLPGVAWSDHWSFWQFRYPAAMVTDTAPFRYPYYHTAKDTPDKLDYARMATVTEGIADVVHELANE